MIVDKRKIKIPDDGKHHCYSQLAIEEKNYQMKITHQCYSQLFCSWGWMLI
jgi:hypothetical protein